MKLKLAVESNLRELSNAAYLKFYLMYMKNTHEDMFDVLQTLEITQALSFKINHLFKWNQLEGEGT